MADKQITTETTTTTTATTATTAPTAPQPQSPSSDKPARFLRFRHILGRLKKRLYAFRLPFRDIDIKTAGKLTVSAAALLAVLLMIAVRADLSPAAIVRGAKDKQVLSAASGEGFPYDIKGSRSLQVEPVSHGTAVLTDSVCAILDKDGKEIVCQTHYMANPVLRTADRYMLLFDKMAKVYCLRTLSGNICTGHVDHSIFTGDVSRSGCFALVTKHDTAYAHIYVFSKKGDVLHKWKSSVYHISDIAVSPSGHLVAMCGTAADDEGKLRSCVLIQKVGGSENLREYLFDDTLLFSVRFTDNDSVTAIGDDLTARVFVGSDKKLTYSYQNRTLTGFDAAENGSVALALSQHSDGQNASVVILNASCEEIGAVETSLSSPAVELTGGRVNAVGQSRFYSWTIGGRLLHSGEVPADVHRVLTSEGHVIAGGTSTITCID